MGRHSDGKPNYRVAKGPLISLLAAILVGAMIFAWVTLRTSDGDDPGISADCSKGDLTLVVAADPAVAGVVREQVDAWAATDPVVREYCVRPQVTVNGSQQILDVIREHGDDAAEGDADGSGGATGSVKPVLPAVWVPADDSFVDAARDSGGVGVDGETARFSPQPVGLAVASDRAADVKGQSWDDIADMEDLAIATPGGPDAVVSSVVNARLTPDARGRELLDASEERLAAGGRFTSEALLGQLAKDTAEGYDAVAATQSMVDASAQTGSEGLSFISPNGSPALSAPMVAFTSGGPVNEVNARAAAEFVKYARKNGVDADAPGDGDDETAAGALDGAAGEILPDVAARDTDPFAGIDAEDSDSDGAGDDSDGDAATTEPAGSTLVLLDTSEGMDLDAVREALTPLMDRAIDGEGRRVALWNYSSPLSAGVTTPVRQNVHFGAGAKDRSVEVLGQLSTGGEPWLWRSVGPAVDYVAEAWSPGVANRVVLVTSGSDATDDDAAAAIERISAAATTDRPVRVDVVVVGEDSTDGALRDLASATGGSVQVAGTDPTAALVKAMGL